MCLRFVVKTDLSTASFSSRTTLRMTTNRIPQFLASLLLIFGLAQRKSSKFSPIYQCENPSTRRSTLRSSQEANLKPPSQPPRTGRWENAFSRMMSSPLPYPNTSPLTGINIPKLMPKTVHHFHHLRSITLPPATQLVTSGWLKHSWNDFLSHLFLLHIS
jgi:hypothetical protein